MLKKIIPLLFLILLPAYSIAQWANNYVKPTSGSYLIPCGYYYVDQYGNGYVARWGNYSTNQWRNHYRKNYYGRNYYTRNSYRRNHYNRSQWNYGYIAKHGYNYTGQQGYGYVTPWREYYTNQWNNNYLSRWKNTYYMPGGYCCTGQCGLPWGDGFYLGIGAGVDATNFKRVKYVTIPGFLDVTDKIQLGGQDFFGDIYAGFSRVFCRILYLAAEINGAQSKAESRTFNIDSFHPENVGLATYRIKQTWGAGLLPGIILPQNTLLYGRVGYVRGNLQISTNQITSLANVDTWLNGIRFGVGIEKQICRNLSLRFDYSHIEYQKHRDLVLDVKTDGSPNVLSDTNIFPKSNQFLLELQYRFPC